MKSLGSLKQPCLKAKGGETRCLVKFATELLERNDCGHKGKLLALAGRELMRHYEIMDMESRRMTLKGRQELVTTAVNHCSLYKAVGGHMVHKHHGWIHMSLSAGRTGNPKCVSTYEDEHENGVIALIGGVCHGTTFSRSIFERLELQDRRFSCTVHA